MSTRFRPMKHPSRLAFSFIIMLSLCLALTGTMFAARKLVSAMSGLVLDQLGKPVANTKIYIYARNYENSLNSPEWRTLVAETKTGKNGRYSASLPAGTYRVMFEPENRDLFAMEGYPDAPVIDLADDVQVFYGRATSNISVVLDPAGWIQGRVTDAVTGYPVAGMEVEAEVQCSTYINSMGSTLTDEDGFYRISGFKPYPFFIWANKYSGLADYSQLMLGFDEWVPEPPDFKTVDLNIQESDFVNLSGTLLDQNEDPAAGVTIYPWLLMTDPSGEQRWDNRSEWSTVTDENGLFQMKDLEQGTYVISTNGYGSDHNYQWEYFDNAIDAFGAQKLDVYRGIETELPGIWYLQYNE